MVDEERFYRTAAGEEVPSVSTILRVIDKSGPLVSWAVRVTCDYVGERLHEIHDQSIGGVDMHDIEAVLEKAEKEATRVKEAAGDMGTLVHLAVQDWAISMMGGQEFFAHFSSPEMQRAWEAFTKFEEQYSMSPTSTELKVVHEKHKYGGQVDLIANILPPGQDKPLKYLIDIKSSNFFLEIPYGPQVAAYADMFPPKAFDGIAVLHLDKKTGTPNFHDLTPKREEYLAIFKAAHDLWKAMRGTKKRRTRK